MSQDERGTIRTLTAYKEAMSSLIQEYKGRVVDSPGDNLMAEFGSVVDAVNCAVEIQRELAERNAELRPARQMEFRIGINLGDVVEEEDRIYGDGVNIAARVEGLAEGGGICISGTAYDQVVNKLGLEYEFLGEQEVKNIERPVRVYRVLSFPGAAAHRVIQARETMWKRWRRAALAIAVVLVIGAGAVAIWNFYLRPAPSVEPASVEKMAFPLPDKPSIAVLPFVNISGEPKEDYFSDGITEEIITGLSKVPRLFVIARNSTFTYKGKPVKVQQVAEELGVRYVLEGSVRKAGERLRITAQLVDAITGKHLWAEKYDRDLKDIFALQDEIMMKVIAALQVKLTEGEQALIVAGGTDNFEAYAKFLQGLEYIKRFNKDGNLLARKMAEEAITLDPSYPRGYRLLATTHWLDVGLGISKSPRKSLAKAAELYKKVITLDPSEAVAHGLLGMVYTFMRQHEKGIAEAEKAVALNPNAADAQCFFGNILHFNGRHKEAIEAIKKAIRLNPFPPNWYFMNLGYAYGGAGMYEEAITACQKALRVKPDNLFAHRCLAAAYSLSGREEEAHAEVAEILRINPKLSLQYFAKTTPYKNPHDTELLIDALRKAGLPEKPPLPLPDKPSIAVLPFVNMSDDPQQEYFGDGMADDLITDLSKVSGLVVISRHSTFAYKGKSIEIKQIAENLGAQYVLEGSVRKVGDQVRINAQLIDAATQHHLWAERFDGPLTDIFAVQDKIARKIVASLAVTLTEREQEDVHRKGTNNVKAHDAFLKGADLMKRYYPDRVPKAIAYFEEALNIDPNYSRAYASLSEAYLFAGIYGGRLVGLSPQECFLRSEHYREISMKDPTAGSYGVNAFFLLPVQRRWEEAIADGERCVALAPNESSAWHSLDWALIWGGRPEEAIDVAGTSLSVDPGCVYCAYQARGFGKFAMGKLEEALNCFERAYEFQPENKIMSLRSLAVTNALLGRIKEARQFIAPYIKMGLSLPCLMPPFKDPKSEKLWADGLLKAGVSGEPGGYYKSAIFLEPNLTAKEIKDQVFGRTISGFDICGGKEWSIERTEDGKATIHRDKIADTGKSWIDGDKLCNKWENLYGGYKDCMRVYVNPEGTKERKDQYIGTAVYGLVPFSVVD
jgi:TolB-like protein/Flp pilus assembly protein TadD